LVAWISNPPRTRDTAARGRVFEAVAAPHVRFPTPGDSQSRSIRRWPQPGVNTIRYRVAPVGNRQEGRRGVTSHLRPRLPGGSPGTVGYNPPLSLSPSSSDVAVDVACVARMAQRDATAASDLYDAHSRLMFGVICRIVGDRTEAEEVLQEAFVQAWTHAATYKPALGSPAGWLLGIARHRAIDRMRANAVRTRTADAVEEPAPVPTPEGAAEASERQREVRRALALLPADQRALILDAYFLGLTQSELADRHGLPLGTVKTRMRTGLHTLRRQLETRLLQL
jgi:RNA polymerase sigma-70 factor, ECF subfamily